MGFKHRLSVVICGAVVLIASLISLPVSADTTAMLDAPDLYYRGRVTAIIDTGTTSFDGVSQPWQTLEIAITSGNERGTTTTIDNGKNFVIGVYEPYEIGDRVVVSRPAVQAPGARLVRYIYDRYRVPQLLMITVVFLALALYFGRRRGFTSVIGLVVSIVGIFYIAIPLILRGRDPFLVCLGVALAICVISLYVSHGFNRRTTVALVGSLGALAVAAAINVLYVGFARLTGVGTEEAFYLQFDGLSLDVRGVLMGGIILGVLGVLDDATTGQAAAVEEIHFANPTLPFRSLYERGLSVGREHIASLINTLVLAYVGASFPFLLLFARNTGLPLWVMFNSNFIAEELVRTLVGSTALVIAVPLTNVIAAYVYARSHTSNPG